MAALDTVRSEFKFVSDLLGDGRPFICGSALTAADITFVSLSLPALNVPYAAAAPLSDPNVFTPPLALAAAVLELRSINSFFFLILLFCCFCTKKLELAVLLLVYAFANLHITAGTAAGAWAVSLYERERSVVLLE